jgi:hypothetical protein
MNPDVEEPSPARRFVHLDVFTAHSPWCSPSTPEQYVQALARQYPLGPNTDGQLRPALALADYGLHWAVKTAVACQRAGIDHIVGLRVRVVSERGYRTWGERVGELILLAMAKLAGCRSSASLTGDFSAAPIAASRASTGAIWRPTATVYKLRGIRSTADRVTLPFRSLQHVSGW